MAMLTLGEAARMTGLGKTTLARSIKAGRLSATRTDAGSYQIDAAELARVYPFPAPTTDATHATVAATGPVAHHATHDVTLRLALADERLSELKAALADMRDQRDKWQAQAERLALAAPLTTPAPAPARSWWKRLAG
jgi:excisionase family DNA binding protein